MYLGVDAGGTRSTALVVDEHGRTRGRADGGPANYQTIGADAARRSLDDVVSRALGAAGVEPSDVTWAGYGIAGADRPKDFDAVRAQLSAAALPERRTLVNDSQLALWAGTDDGVGVALVSGTGTNAIARGPGGRIANVGGYCYELGDFGSAGDLGREALRLAMRGREGRGDETSLYEKLCAKLEVDPLEDVIDRWMRREPDAEDYGAFAPLVFEAAAEGDAVARELLVRAGQELALAALVLIDRVLGDEAELTVVLGGSVLQKGGDPTLIRTIARELDEVSATVRVVRLVAEPVIGAVLLAHAGPGPGPNERAAFVEGLRAEHGPSFVEPVTGWR